MRERGRGSGGDKSEEANESGGPRLKLEIEEYMSKVKKMSMCVQGMSLNIATLSLSLSLSLSLFIFLPSFLHHLLPSIPFGLVQVASKENGVYVYGSYSLPSSPSFIICLLSIHPSSPSFLPSFLMSPSLPSIHFSLVHVESKENGECI